MKLYESFVVRCILRIASILYVRTIFSTHCISVSWHRQIRGHTAGLHVDGRDMSPPIFDRTRSPYLRSGVILDDSNVPSQRKHLHDCQRHCCCFRTMDRERERERLFVCASPRWFWQSIIHKFREKKCLPPSFSYILMRALWLINAFFDFETVALGFVSINCFSLLVHRRFISALLRARPGLYGDATWW